MSSPWPASLSSLSHIQRRQSITYNASNHSYAYSYPNHGHGIQRNRRRLASRVFNLSLNHEELSELDEVGQAEEQGEKEEEEEEEDGRGLASPSSVIDVTSEEGDSDQESRISLDAGVEGDIECEAESKVNSGTESEMDAEPSVDLEAGYDAEAIDSMDDTADSPEDILSPDSTMDSNTLDRLRADSLSRLSGAWNDIFIKYGKPVEELPPDDVLDLWSGTLIVDNGVLKSKPRIRFGTLTVLGKDIKTPLMGEPNDRFATKRPRVSPESEINEDDEAHDQDPFDRWHGDKNRRRPLQTEDKDGGGNGLMSIPKASPNEFLGSPNPLRQHQGRSCHEDLRATPTYQQEGHKDYHHELWGQRQPYFAKKLYERYSGDEGEKEDEDKMHSEMEGDGEEINSEEENYSKEKIENEGNYSQQEIDNVENYLEEETDNEDNYSEEEGEEKEMSYHTEGDYLRGETIPSESHDQWQNQLPNTAPGSAFRRDEAQDERNECSDCPEDFNYLWPLDHASGQHSQDHGPWEHPAITDRIEWTTGGEKNRASSIITTLSKRKLKENEHARSWFSSSWKDSMLTAAYHAETGSEIEEDEGSDDFDEDDSVPQQRYDPPPATPQRLQTSLRLGKELVRESAPPFARSEPPIMRPRTRVLRDSLILKTKLHAVVPSSPTLSSTPPPQSSPSKRQRSRRKFDHPPNEDHDNIKQT